MSAYDDAMIAADWAEQAVKAGLSARDNLRRYGEGVLSMHDRLETTRQALSRAAEVTSGGQGIGGHLTNHLEAHIDVALQLNTQVIELANTLNDLILRVAADASVTKKWAAQLSK